MEEQKYFVPKIEDIYSGYEYERERKGKWEKVREFSNDYDYEDNPHYALMKDIQNGKIRVPYLTKEQIKAEGWKEIFNRHDGFGKYSYFQKGTTHITFQEKEHLIEIHNDEDYDEHKTWYNGKCRCINEFRTICKLLEI